MKRYVLTVLCLLPFAASAFIFVDPVNLVQNTTTAANSVTSLLNQADMIRHQLQVYQQNFTSLQRFHYRDIGNSIRQLDSITQQGRSISYAMQDIDTKFKQYYPDYSHQQGAINYTQAYQGWNRTSMTTFSNSLRAIGSNTESVQHEDQLMQQLKSQSQNAQGRIQVMQTANEMSAENVRQLESLKHLIAAQSNAQTAYMAQQVSQSSYREKSLDQLVKHSSTQFPRYHNNPAFGKIKR